MQVGDPISIYQIVSMLQGVVNRGTGARLRRTISHPLAGKTGTTNDSMDTWFMGFTPDLVAGVYVGFDNPKTLGHGETGSSVSVPIFQEFMEQALATRPATPFRVPPGIRMVRMNTTTGLPARPGDDPREVVLEAFRRGTEPRKNDELVILDGSDDDGPPTVEINVEDEEATGTVERPDDRREPPKAIKKSTDTGLY